MVKRLAAKSQPATKTGSLPKAKTTGAKGAAKPAGAKAAPVKAVTAKVKPQAAKPAARKGEKLVQLKAPVHKSSSAKPASVKAPVPAKPVAKSVSGKLMSSKAAVAVTPKSPVKAVAHEAKPEIKATVEKPITAKTVASKPVAAKPAPANTNTKPVGKVKFEFGPNDYVVYPTHGVGRIVKVEQQEFSGMRLDLFVIEFEKDKMTLRVPVAKVSTVGMRKLSSPQKMKSALDTLKGRARVKRAMWSRRAQEYEAKINSGDPVSIAEVVRDLHRNAGQPDQSYSERQIYEAALDRLARELAAVEKIDEESAAKRLEKVLRAA